MPSKKLAMFTDIHFGKKNNSPQHNQDCLDFVDWFCRRVTEEGNVTHILFLGDWFENRNSVNVLTLTYAHEALRRLTSLGLPIYMLVGNHDLYYRENRKIYSTRIFGDFKHITMVNEPTVLDRDLLLCPFIFKEEGGELAKFRTVPFWFGHFEFKNFIITGSDRRMETGLEHTLFKEQRYIFTGHFHKRQAQDNVIYIGNTFPMDYGDAGDDARGCCFFDVAADKVWFEDWVEAPTYRKIRLSEVLGGNIAFPSKCRVRCLVDTEILYSEAQALREEMVKLYDLREFSLEENEEEKRAVLEGEDVIETFELSSLNDAVVKMIKTGIQGTNAINPDRLVDIYLAL
jgi:DNA repair exonuclease SbcCD nuclease subunit